MKKAFVNLLLLITILFLGACACTKEETISKEDATQILKETKLHDNVEVTITTETITNEIVSTSTQKDIYYMDKYYHSSSNNNIDTQTWYGAVDNSFYAFYYTKNANNEEEKNSSKIESTLIDSTKKQLNGIIENLFDESGNLLAKYETTATKKGNVYTITLKSNTEEEREIYTITITNNKIEKIIKEYSIFDNTIKTTYDYKYDITDFDLPSLNEYPLVTNG